jgi:prepilin-type N-terminal cleavage/methylation domain-containing protein
MKFRTKEKGFTLVELLVALTILGAITGALSMVVITLMKISPQSNDWALALRQVQNAGYWISRDVQMSQDIIINPNADTFLTLTVPYESDGAIDTKEIEYKFETLPPDQEEWFTRTDSIDGKTVIAQYISNATAEPYDPNTRTLTFTITATSGDKTVSRQYEATQRVPPAQ